MLIRQTQEQVKDSMALNANTEINSVRLAAAHLWSISSDLISSDAVFESEVGFRLGEIRRVHEALVFAINFKFTVKTSKDESKPKDLLKITCLLEGEYRLNPKFDPTEQQIKAFHAGNAVFNCWPYFREFVQNSAVRMHFPPPPVPFLRMQPMRAKDKSPALLPAGKAPQEVSTEK